MLEKGIIYSLWLLLIGISGCAESTSYFPTIDQSNPLRPVIETKLKTCQIDNGEKAGWETISGLFIVTGGKVSSTNVACNYNRSGRFLSFTPKLPLGSGLEFEVQFYINEGTIKKRFKTPELQYNGNGPSVVDIYPLASSIPSNILMFHAVFDTPMDEDTRAYENIKLLDENGLEKKLVWREKSNWTDSGRHLVLMLHPGRIKRGIDYVNGPLFEAGKQYTLIITTALKDRNNKNLTKEFSKTFTAIAPDREIPLFMADSSVFPRYNTRQPLLLTFSERMDYGAMQIGTVIKDSTGSRIDGKLNTTDGIHWSFTPAPLWEKALYTIELNDYITDCTGNHLNRKFEVEDINHLKQRSPTSFTFTPFQ